MHYTSEDTKLTLEGDKKDCSGGRRYCLYYDSVTEDANVFSSLEAMAYGIADSLSIKNQSGFNKFILHRVLHRGMKCNSSAPYLEVSEDKVVVNNASSENDELYEIQEHIVNRLNTRLKYYE